MKRIWNMLLCLLLITATVITVSAAGSAQMTISLNKATAYRGDTVDFSVAISQVEDCRSAAFMLSYDSSVFEFVSGSCTLSGTALANFSAGTGTFAYGSGTTVSGTIFTFKLKVKDDAAFGNYTISANVNTRDSNGAIPTTVNSVHVYVACNHSYSNWTAAGEKHQRTCSVCGDVNTDNHSWNNPVVVKEANCKEGGQERYTCRDCGATKLRDTEKTNNHKYGNWSQENNDLHHRFCSVCQREDSAYHSWGSGSVTQKATCKEEGVKTFTCQVCRSTRTEKIAVLTTHTYDHNCDADCNVCGKTRSITHNYRASWSNDKTNHWHECSVCKEKKDLTKHTPGAAATETNAQTCTVCGYIIQPALGHKHNYGSQWTTDEKGHWYACSGCEEQGSYAAHGFENACDPDCSICGYTREPAHTYAEAWTWDETNHWHMCTVCGLKAEEVAHTPGAAATETTAQTCTVCGYEIAPASGGQATEPSDATESTTPVEPDPPATESTTPVEQEPPTKESFPWWIVVIAVVVVAGGAVAFVILKKKKA